MGLIAQEHWLRKVCIHLKKWLKFGLRLITCWVKKFRMSDLIIEVHRGSLGELLRSRIVWTHIKLWMIIHSTLSLWDSLSNYEISQSSGRLKGWPPKEAAFTASLFVEISHWENEDKKHLKGFSIRISYQPGASEDLPDKNQMRGNLVNWQK